MYVVSEVLNDLYMSRVVASVLDMHPTSPPTHLNKRLRHAADTWVLSPDVF